MERESIMIEGGRKRPRKYETKVGQRGIGKRVFIVYLLFYMRVSGDDCVSDLQ